MSMGFSSQSKRTAADPLTNWPMAGEADRPMSEFWTGEYPDAVNKEMASSAHVYGRPMIGAGILYRGYF